MPNNEELLDILLGNRGIKEEDREKFLNPKYEDLYDPFLMKDMERVCVRIFEAIQAKEKIAIYSDYDCDGIPAAVIMHDFFKKINYDNFFIYIPHRQDEGYGLHIEAITEFIKNGVKLLITFDLGITAFSEVTQAQAEGIDVIITDHHLPIYFNKERPISDNLPHAYAILNPKQKNCKYPDKMICGAGIAFKLIQALIKKYGEYWKIHSGWEKWLLDMVGIATLADQVPLLNENRVFAYYGLKVLQKGKRLGLIELFNKTGINIKDINEEDITFLLAPRINAASRMADPMQAFEVLATNDMVKAKTLASYLIKINNDRKQMVALIMKEVKKTLLKREEKTFIIIGNPNWKIGVLGIIASKIAEEYKKSVFVWGSQDGDIIRGSCRGWGNINLIELMSLLPENSLLSFGGHAGAGGFTVSHKEIHFLEERILSVFSEDKDNKINEKEKIDANITIDDITNENYKVIEKLAPFGVNNPKPTFLLKGVIVNSIKEFGKEKNHLELSFLNSKNKIIKAISFFKTAKDFFLKEGNKINLIVTFEKNTFGGKNELRLRIIDVI